MFKKCMAPFCERNQYCKGFCQRHYGQIYQYGCLLKRTQKDPNQYLINEDVCSISLYNHKGIKIAEAIINSFDYEKCKHFKWHMVKYGYVSSNEVGLLHNFLMDRNTSNRKEHCDHKDGNPLNNLRNNLQIITCGQNQMKGKIHKNNTSNYKGVSFSKKNRIWVSYIYKDRHRIHIGSFPTKEEAALAYNGKAKELFGRFAILNEIRRLNESR